MEVPELVVEVCEVHGDAEGALAAAADAHGCADLAMRRATATSPFGYCLHDDHARPRRIVFGERIDHLGTLTITG